MRDLLEVGPLSRETMLVSKPQSLSARLQSDIRFLQHPLPAIPSAYLAACFPVLSDLGELRAYHVPHEYHLWVRSDLSAGGALSTMGELGTPIPDRLPFGSSVCA
jgi:hypothetical protein